MTSMSFGSVIASIPVRCHCQLSLVWEYLVKSCEQWPIGYGVSICEQGSREVRRIVPGDLDHGRDSGERGTGANSALDMHLWSDLAVRAAVNPCEDRCLILD